MKQTQRQEAMQQLQETIIACEKCPRLRDWCRQVAVDKVKRYADQDYWGAPVPGFGDTNARLIILGLAPGAHGANRTGRVFTGDESGKWLYEALHRFGFANRPDATSREDGLVLTDAYINNIVRCAPPQNKPTAAEIHACQDHLLTEFDLLANKQVVLALGKLAFDKYKNLLKSAGRDVKDLTFAHGALYQFDDSSPALLASYHPSQQNTFTGKLTQEMWTAIFEQAKHLLV
ncbi:MAG TPA: uracil-DNA glycosylase [Bacilli bacterium]|nr:uracil-DNA glycosylase [Bacilli bacterium]